MNHVLPSFRLLQGIQSSHGTFLPLLHAQVASCTFHLVHVHMSYSFGRENNENEIKSKQTKQQRKKQSKESACVQPIKVNNVDPS